ncbi:MAG TPA: hypothetical protein VI168_04800 [Croceibacterium sp.]
MEFAAPFTDPLEIALQRELRRSERVLWRGRPLPRVVWRALAIWLFAVPWTAFSLFWTAMAFAGAQAFDDGVGLLSYAFPLFGTPFIAVGVGMLSVPFVPLFTARRTLFAVTDQRLLRIYLGRRLKTRSVEGSRVGEIERSEHSDGSGSLKVVIGSHLDSDGDRRIDTFELGEVENVMAVEARVRELADRVRRAELSSGSSTRS